MTLALSLAWLVTLVLWFADRRRSSARKEAAAPEPRRVDSGKALAAVDRACRNGDAPAVRDALLADIEKHEINHVIITGDITNSGSAREFKKAKLFVDKLSNGRRVSIIPGNHDIDLQRYKRGRKKIVERKLATVGPLPDNLDRQEIYARLDTAPDHDEENVHK